MQTEESAARCGNLKRFVNLPEGSLFYRLINKDSVYMKLSAEDELYYKNIVRINSYNLTTYSLECIPEEEAVIPINGKLLLSNF